MKAILKNLVGVDPRMELEIGKEYQLSIKQYGSGLYAIIEDDMMIPISSLESPVERFERLIPNANKVILVKPTTGVTVDLLQTQNYLVVYSHTRGNHWNIGGYHYKYWHNVDTGEYVKIDYFPNKETEKVEWKQRILKADYLRLQKLIRH